MKVSAFTYVRNGITLDYPFVEAIKSVLPLVQEFIVVIGDSNDGTRDAVENIKDNRIKIIDTVWDSTMLQGGLVFAQQANIGLENISENTDWIFHIQADELIHEKDIELLQNEMQKHLPQKNIEGILFPFINFYGDYKHYAPSRRFHQHEIRIIRNNKNFKSYKDSQGFRSFEKSTNGNLIARKLNVVKTNASIYHYSWAKPPKFQKLKRIEFGNRYGGTTDKLDYENELYTKAYENTYNYREYDYLKTFTKSHPLLMRKKVESQDWNFEYNPSKNNMKPKEKLLKWIEDLTGLQLFIYKNYKLF